MASPRPSAEARLLRELRATRRLAARAGGTALLGLGTYTALCSKLAYEMRGVASPGAAPRAFRHPVFMTLASFAAMALCLVLDAWHRRPKRGGASAGPAGDDAGRMTDPVIRGPGDRVHLGGPTSPAPPPPSSDAGSLAAPLLHRGDSDALPPSGSSSSEPSPYSSSSLVAKALFDFASLAYRLVPVTALDVLATALVSCALLRLPLSAFLALRHAQLLSAALVKALIRGIRELNPLHKLGASLSLSGAALVVLAVVVDAPEEAPPPLLTRASAATQGLLGPAADDDEGFSDTRASRLVGVALLAASQFTQALQLTFEARFLPGYAFFYEEARAGGGGVGAHARRALRRIGAEGVVGCVLCVCVVFPVASFFERRSKLIIPGAGAGEDAWAAWAMVRRTPVLAAFLAAYVLVSAAYAAVGAGVGPFLGVASRGAMETMRFFACWGATLALGAAAADDEGGGGGGGSSGFARAGERLSAPGSALQLGGFVMGALATLLYGRGDAAERRGVFARDGRLREEEERRFASATGSARRRRPGVEELGTANGGSSERRPGVSRDGRDGSSESPRSSGSAEGSASSRGERFGRGGTDRSEPFGGGATSAPRARAEDRSDFRTLADAEAGAGGDGADLSSEPSSALLPESAPFATGSLRGSMSFSSFGGVAGGGGDRGRGRDAREPRDAPGRVVAGFDIPGAGEGGAGRRG